jgi:hypothetical protein
VEYVTLEMNTEGEVRVCSSEKDGRELQSLRMSEEGSHKAGGAFKNPEYWDQRNGLLTQKYVDPSGRPKNAV